MGTAGLTCLDKTGYYPVSKRKEGDKNSTTNSLSTNWQAKTKSEKMKQVVKRFGL